MGENNIIDFYATFTMITIGWKIQLEPFCLYDVSKYGVKVGRLIWKNKDTN